MITGIHHFAIIVSSKKSVLFYEKLGFVVTFRKERDYDAVVVMEGYGIEIEVFIDPNHPIRSNPEPFGLRHLAFQVESFEQIRKEFVCGPVMKDWIGRSYCFAVDPDGNVIEFHE